MSHRGAIGGWTRNIPGRQKTLFFFNLRYPWTCACHVFHLVEVISSLERPHRVGTCQASPEAGWVRPVSCPISPKNHSHEAAVSLYEVSVGHPDAVKLLLQANIPRCALLFAVSYPFVL